MRFQDLSFMKLCYVFHWIRKLHEKFFFAAFLSLFWGSVHFYYKSINWFLNEWNTDLKLIFGSVRPRKQKENSQSFIDSLDEALWWCWQGKSGSSRPEVFLGKGVQKICSKFAREHPWRSAISPLNLLHIFTTHFPKNNSVRLLLKLYKGLVNCIFLLLFFVSISKVGPRYISRQWGLVHWMEFSKNRNLFKLIIKTPENVKLRTKDTRTTGLIYFTCFGKTLTLYFAMS